MPKQLPAFAKHSDKKPVKSSISHFPVVFAGIPNVKEIGSLHSAGKLINR